MPVDAPRARLLLLRHAEAQAAPGPDYERPLTAAGHRAAAELGAQLRARGIRPDRVLCSPALRTRQTWQALALNCEALRLEAALYGAGAAGLRAHCAALEAYVGCALLIGHNPGISALAAQLAEAAPPAHIRQRLARGLRPCALAEFAIAADWAALAPAPGAPGGAALLALHEPAPPG